MIIKIENRCGCLEIGDGFGCIDIFVPDACSKENCRKSDACTEKFFIETPRAGIKVAVKGGKPEGEIRLKA